MISAATFYGGATTFASGGAKVLTESSPRIIQLTATSSSPPNTVQLPSFNPLGRADMVESSLGRPRFIVLNTGTVSHAVLSDTGSTLATLGNNQWAAFSRSGTAWRRIGGGAVGGSATAGASRSESIAAIESELLGDEFCFRGDDCEYATDNGNVPLDGQGGHPAVLAPMYQDPVRYAASTDIPMVRAADVFMPKLIPVRFVDGEFAVDTNHPLSGSASLSESFFDALHNRGTQSSLGSEPHLLEYDAVLSVAGVSSNWHHSVASVAGGPVAWSIGDGTNALQVRKHVWRKVVEYTPTGTNQTKTLDIRFVMEHSMASDVPASCSSGPDGEDEFGHKGMWGALFYVAVFSDEFSFTDGGNFTPAGFTNPVAFSKSDPCVGGASKKYRDAHAGNVDETLRGVHPQCVILAHLPTTYHQPVGRNRVPLTDSTYYKPFEGPFDGDSARNLERCYDVPNGCPWLDRGACFDTFPCRTDATPMFTWGIFSNCVFGRSPRTAPTFAFGKACTLGGDMLRSQPYNYLCFDNAGAVGLCLLAPVRPGWSASCGKLDIQNGSSGDISVCVAAGNRPSAGATSDEVWPVCPDMSICDGHPVEKLGGWGGSLGCFRTSDSPQLCEGGQPGDCPQPNRDNATCCIPIGSGGIAGAYEYCTRTTNVYTGDPLFGCETSPQQKCDTISTYYTQFLMQYANCDFVSTDTAGREIRWGRVLPSPLYPRRSWTYTSTGTLWTNQRGTLTRASGDATFSATTGGAGLSGVATFDDTTNGSWDWFGVSMTCRFVNIPSGQPHGLGFFDSSNDGYGVVAAKSGADVVVTVVRYDTSGTVRTTLSSITIAGAGGVPGTCAFFVHGATIRATYTPQAGSATVLEVEDGTRYMIVDAASVNINTADSISTLKPALITEGAATGAKFDTFSVPFILDLVPRFFGIEAIYRDGFGSVTLNSEMYYGFGKCTEDSGNLLTCGPIASPPTCDCEFWQNQIYRATSFSWTGGDIPALQRFSGCAGIDIPCNELGNLYGTETTYPGGPVPSRCRCNAEPCSNSSTACTKCPDSGKPYLYFAPPSDYRVWDAPSDPNCAGSTPLICKGISSNPYTPIACL